jgi:hypothetical protein
MWQAALLAQDGQIQSAIENLREDLAPLPGLRSRPEESRDVVRKRFV